MNNQKLQQTAIKRAKAKVEFRIHLITFIVINTLLVIINLIFTPEYIWFKWPLLGWGIGIVLHRREVNFLTKQSLMNRLIEKEMEKQ